MPELLLELGCEELPASAVRRGYTELADAISKRLEQQGIEFGSVRSLGTPRRLIVQILDVAERQPDTEKESRGPSLQAAYDADGQPSKALLGFCRSQGIDPAEVRQEGEYVWAKKSIPGRATAEVLNEILPDAVRSLTFEKTMRWGSARMRFVRPIRWILAVFGGSALEFEVAGVAAGATSRGHRFNRPEAFEARDLDQLLEELVAREVQPDPEERERLILEQSQAVATGSPVLSPGLVDENVFLTEWPTALQGEFNEEFLDLPEPVLITAMAKHERFFPVRNEDGALANRFVSIRNGGEEATVRAGNEWVLNARFNDAKFFFDEDRRLTMDQFLEKTQGILFHEKLGTVRERADRLAVLAGEIARQTRATSEETAWARQAGLYAKADLSSGLVSELSSLQGIIGGEYARREGMPEEVAFAIAGQYDLGLKVDVSSPKGRTQLRLILADQLDKLAGYLGVGLVPSGSSDPFGLRRAATAVIEIAWMWPDRSVKPFPLLRAAMDGYEGAGIELERDQAFAALAEIFSARYQALLENVRHDVLDAALLPEDLPSLLDPRGVRLRTRALGLALPDAQFVFTATRPLNIVAAAEKKGVPFSRTDPLRALERENLQSKEADELLAAIEAVEQPLYEAEQSEDWQGMIEALLTLQGPINQFFDTTMVMVEDPDVRHARLSLLNAAAQRLRSAGDFSKLVME
jgi:glycyl-tRNA synthetase beta chain